MAASGTGAMEASVSNLTSPGDRVLVLSAGKFGERWTSLAKAFGCEADVVTRSMARHSILKRFAGRSSPTLAWSLCREPKLRLAFGIAWPGVAELIKSAGSDALLVVDGITGLGTTHLDVDALGCGRDHRRLAEGGDDSSGPCLSGCERESILADGDDEESTLLLRPAQGAEERARRATPPTRRQWH